MDIFPTVLREREKLPRTYIANCIYTVVGEPFAQWVNQLVNERHARMVPEDDTIHLDPEIAAIFKASTATSGKCCAAADLGMISCAAVDLDMIDLFFI